VDFDLVVRSSDIVTPSGHFRGQIGIKNERIAALLDSDLDVSAARTIDAGDRLGVSFWPVSGCASAIDLHEGVDDTFV